MFKEEFRQSNTEPLNQSSHIYISAYHFLYDHLVEWISQLLWVKIWTLINISAITGFQYLWLFMFRKFSMAYWDTSYPTPVLTILYSELLSLQSCAEEQSELLFLSLPAHTDLLLSAHLHMDLHLLRKNTTRPQHFNCNQHENQLSGSWNIALK